MITEDQKYWIKTVDERAKSMPLNAEGKLFGVSGIDELGSLHLEEYKSFEFNIPPEARKGVAIDRLEGFIGIRNYIYENNTNEQKFHVDASIVGAVLYAESILDDFNDILLKHKKNIENIKSDILSELLSKISISKEFDTNIERVDPKLNPPSIKTIKKDGDYVNDLISSNDIEEKVNESEYSIIEPVKNIKLKEEKKEEKKLKIYLLVGYLLSIFAGFIGILFSLLLVSEEISENIKGHGYRMMVISVISLLIKPYL